MTATLTTLVNLNGASGQGSNAGLIADANGDLFGTEESGGTSNRGTVFEIVNNGTAANPSYATVPTVLASFNGTNGQTPFAGLIADANGDLFGTTQYGGANNDGEVFEIRNNGTAANPSYATAPTVLVSFNNADGAKPIAGLIADANGDLFGTTQYGGANNNGTVFEIVNNGTVANPNYATEPTLVSPAGEIPSPGGALIADANGDLFGTSFAASGSYGYVFEIKNNGTAANPTYAAAPTVLVSFNSADGYGPTSLIADANGDLFGTTVYGGTGGGSYGYGDGTVFEIVNNGTAANPSYAAAPTVLANFNGANGANPNAGVIIDAKGDLFGTTTQGGAYGDGTVFEIVNNGTAANPSYATAPTILENFNGFNGALLYAGLMADAKGDLFGTTIAGGANGAGDVFEITGSGFVPVAINGTAQEAQTLTAAVFGNPASYQWQVLVGGNWVDISGATGASYLVQPVDDGRQIRLQVADSSGITATSAATNAILDANGNQPVYETDSGSVIGNGHLQSVYGTATNTTVNSGGGQDVFANGTAIGATIDAGGQQVDWGTASNTVLDGGNQYVWGTATGTTVNSGTQYIGSGGTADGTTVEAGGAQVVSTGGNVSGTTLAAGTQSVYGATTADQTTIDAGGLQVLHSTATNTTINSGGGQDVFADGTAIGTTINTGGQQVDWGAASTTTLDGGNQYVWGTATGTTVNSGTQNIGAGGIASATTIDGGAEHVWAGGTANGVTFGGPSGALTVDQASGLAGSISGLQSGDTIDLGFVSFGSGTTLGYQANTSGPAGGTLTVTDGANVGTLALLGQYSASSFALSSDGNGGTFITEPSTTSASLLASPLHS